MEEVQPTGLLIERQRKAERQRLLSSEYASLFPHLSGGLLELCCGHGHWLTSYAKHHPGVFCVGVDLMNRRIQRSKRKVEKAALEQVHFVKAEAFEFLELLPDALGISTVVILFPDPWPKTRHHRRRLIQPEFLTLLAQKAGPGCRLCFRSDHKEYFEWTRRELTNHPDWHLDESPIWPFEQQTYFQGFMTDFQSLTAKSQ
jgi:tRNA (guanine-N7-)-methyltransferase